MDDPPLVKKRRTQPLFKKGHRVLVPHVDRAYTAQVLRGQKREDGYYYLVHYDGWGSKWDEWVEEAGVTKFDKSQLPIEEGGEQEPGEGTKGTGKKRKAEEEPLPTHLRLHIPALLKKAILDDFEQVNSKGKRLPLPRSKHRRPTVAQILQAYQEAVKAEQEAAAAEIRLRAEKEQEKAEQHKALDHNAEEQEAKGSKQKSRAKGIKQDKGAAARADETADKAAVGKVGQAAAAKGGGRGSKKGGAEEQVEARQPAAKKQRKMKKVDDEHSQPQTMAAAAAPAAEVDGKSAEQSKQEGSKQPPAVPVDETLGEIMEGLKLYFDKALRHFLLYHHEVTQCDEALKAGSGSSPSNIYGVEHLLRLLVKLPDLVPITHISTADKSILQLENRLKDFMVWLTEIQQQARVFSMPEEYEQNPDFNEALLEFYTLPAARAVSAPATGEAAGTGTPQPAD